MFRPFSYFVSQSRLFDAFSLLFIKFFLLLCFVLLMFVVVAVCFVMFVFVGHDFSVLFLLVPLAADTSA